MTSAQSRPLLRRLVQIAMPLWVLAGCALVFHSCKKGDPYPNQSPETYISLKAIHLTGEDRLNSVIRLEWWGTDPDGTVDGYELSFDEVNWTSTPNQDSTFQFAINAGSDTVDIDLWVRAIDNEGAFDQSPAFLKIPLKNTPPEVSYHRHLLPIDTAFNALALSWKASDLDGFESIESVQLKINDGEWFAMSRSIETVVITPKDPGASGAVDADVRLSLQETLGTISGLRLNDVNDVFLRSIDIAGSSSNIDTLKSIFVRGRKHGLLVVGAHSARPHSFYKTYLDQANLDYDFIDMVSDGGLDQPRIWHPTFSIMLAQYEQVLLFSNDVNHTNAQTNADDIILEFASTSIQEYVDGGGKLLITSSFPNAFSTGSALFGILPIDSLSTSVGQARLPIDSLAESLETGYPDLVCGAFISGLDPIYPSGDAMPIYTAQLTKNNGWTGPKTVGVKRQSLGKTNFIFLSVELHKLATDPTAMAAFFDHVFQSEFNW
jgi:hypothetical protein